LEGEEKMKSDRSSSKHTLKRAEPKGAVLTEKAGPEGIKVPDDLSPARPKGGCTVENRLALSRPIHPTAPLERTQESEPPASNGNLLGPDPVGFTRYLTAASAVSLGNIELRLYSEGANFASEALDLWRHSLIHAREPGNIKLYQHRFLELFNRASAAKAQRALVQWAKVCRGLAGPVEGAKKQRQYGTAIDSIFRAQTEAELRQSHIAFTEAHESKLYYERHGCVSCHLKEIPHHACGMCLPCYALISQRRKSIREGKKHLHFKPPARIGVPSPLRKTIRATAE
jgi:hypothetical protein